VVKVDQSTLELSSGAPQNYHLAFLGPKFTKFLLELWFLAAGKKVLNPEIVSMTDLSYSHYLLVIRLQMHFEIFAYFYQTLQHLVCLFCIHVVLQLSS